MKHSFYIIVLIIIFVSCEYHCPGFDINDKSMIPFRLGDSVVYVSNLNDTVKFDVDDFYAEGPSSFKDFFVMDYACNPECYYQMISSSNLHMTIKETYTYCMVICFGKDKPYTQIVFHRPPKYVDSYSEHEVFVNSDYVITVNDLSGQRRIDSFTKAPYHGIIEFHDKQTDLTWTKMINVSK